MAKSPDERYPRLPRRQAPSADRQLARRNAASPSTTRGIHGVFLGQAGTVSRSVTGRLLLALALITPTPRSLAAQGAEQTSPRLHHVGLNTTDVERAISWYLRIWPSAKRDTIAGFPAVAADMLLLFNKVDRPPPGAWRNDLQRAEAQSAFWHIGAFVNTTDHAAELARIGVAHLPLYTHPDDTAHVWRSGLAPYSGTRAKREFPAPPAEPRPGGFSYVVAPDGVLFEFTGGPTTRPSFSHVHFFHEHPACAVEWYTANLGMSSASPAGADTLPSRESGRACERTRGEAGWPSLERVGTIRQPSGTVRYDNGSMSWYPRQCSAERCGNDAPLARSRGQVLDHVAFSVLNFDALFAHLQATRTTILEHPHPFGDTRAFMIEDPDGLAIEIVERTR